MRKGNVLIVSADLEFYTLIRGAMQKSGIGYTDKRNFLKLLQQTTLPFMIHCP